MTGVCCDIFATRVVCKINSHGRFKYADKRSLRQDYCCILEKISDEKNRQPTGDLLRVSQPAPKCNVTGLDWLNTSLPFQGLQVYRGGRPDWM